MTSSCFSLPCATGLLIVDHFQVKEDSGGTKNQFYVAISMGFIWRTIPTIKNLDAKDLWIIEMLKKPTG